MPFIDLEDMVQYLGYPSVEDYFTSSQWDNLCTSVMNLAMDHKGSQWKCRCGRSASIIWPLSYSPEVLRGEDLSQLVACCHRCRPPHRKSVHLLKWFVRQRPLKDKRLCILCGKRSPVGSQLCRPCQHRQRKPSWK
jgi:hypothetical protein